MLNGAVNKSCLVHMFEEKAVLSSKVLMSNTDSLCHIDLQAGHQALPIRILCIGQLVYFPAS